ALVLAAFSSYAGPRGSSARALTLIQQAEEKTNIYKKWFDNRNGPAEQQKTAYEAAKEYLQKFGADNDEYVKAIQKWVARYEKAVRAFDFQKAYAAKDYAKTFELGRQILNDEPD